jgi:hypothetical protein
MFILRSAFWLGLAVVVMHPIDWNAGAQAQALGQQALQTGQKAITTHVNAVQCTTMECAGGKALILASGITDNPLQASSPMQGSQSLVHAPVPRPRLARAG